MVTQHKLGTWMSYDWRFTFWGTWRYCGMVDNVPYLRLRGQVFKLLSGFGNYSLPTHFNCLSEKGVGYLEGCVGLPALQPVPSPSSSCVSTEGHEHLVYPYTWSIVCCAPWCNTPIPSSCHSLLAFKSLQHYE